LDNLLGYQALVKKYRLNVIPHYHASFLLGSGIRRVETKADQINTYYPASYWPGERDGDQLAFALKYEGVNLAILASLFQVLSKDELTDFIQSKPTGKYARRLWFLYEYLTGNPLEIEDLKQGNYIELLDSETYYTAKSPEKVQRQRINNNLLGQPSFCPLVRRTETLLRYEARDLPSQCRVLIAGYSTHLLRRALSYLYKRETRSSFEIEHESPPTDRQERFMRLLQLAEKEDFCHKTAFIELQNLIVDPRYQEKDYRSNQNYVGETVNWQRETIHFVPPKPEDLVPLMAGLIQAHQTMSQNGLSPVVHAAIIAYGFVFLHPFEDGNGRIHRFLVHNILARRQFTPEGIMFPISAVMLKQRQAYEASLDAFSHLLMPLIDYSLDTEGQMQVHNQTANGYRYMDLTRQAEALFVFIEQALEQELLPELEFLLQYDACKQGIQALVDLPDRRLDLLIKYCKQNQGTLSTAKRQKYFAELSNDEVAAIEQIFQRSFSRT
jgi:hypothetical protein